MKSEWFHDPDISLPVIRRRVGEELLDLLVWYLAVSARRGWSWEWSHTFRDRAAYRVAVHRLKKKGLVVYEQQRARDVIIALSDEGEKHVRDVHRPHRRWRRKWNGIWYVLSYDIPEDDRSYRDALRGFLHRLQMGCLHRSVYVTPWDIRPEYDDLVKATGVDRYSFLFESRTVLGRDPRDVVTTAWDLSRLQEIHEWYLAAGKRILGTIRLDKLGRPALENLAREEMTAYVTAMQEDPLLPGALMPAGYRGRDVWEVHKDVVERIGRCLS